MKAAFLMLGAIRQELLSGVRVQEQFRKLRDRSRAFLDMRIDGIDHENAAACLNECRGKGVQGSNTDFLLCAVALRRSLPVFTLDDDVPNYAKVLGVKLHVLRRELE